MNTIKETFTLYGEKFITIRAAKPTDTPLSIGSSLLNQSKLKMDNNIPVKK